MSIIKNLLMVKIELKKFGDLFEKYGMVFMR